MNERTQTGPLVIQGWTLFAHPLFLDQVDTLILQVQALRDKDPSGFIKRNATKRLAAIIKLTIDIVAQDPTRPEYRQGNTLGDDHKHWFRANFFQQYRLFFRFHTPSQMIVLAWVNDDETKRAYESEVDAYLAFKKMLASGHPPNDWDQLLAETKHQHARLKSISGALELNKTDR
ncbi:MAG: type II toxin-antitoxin system YhaV family toxin [Rhizobiales bacterium]|nr:type II toxin-antitoxin system YhaV family toxin [Hyphomicrobiales bacterium]